MFKQSLDLFSNLNQSDNVNTGVISPAHLPTRFVVNTKTICCTVTLIISINSKWSGHHKCFHKPAKPHRNFTVKILYCGCEKKSSLSGDHTSPNTFVLHSAEMFLIRDNVILTILKLLMNSFTWQRKHKYWTGLVQKSQRRLKLLEVCEKNNYYLLIWVTWPFKMIIKWQNSVYRLILYINYAAVPSYRVQYLLIHIPCSQFGFL